MQYNKVCMICGMDFKTQSHNALVCSKPCKNKYRVIWNRMDRERKPKKKRYGSCPICAKKVFLPPKVSSICCSEECSNIGAKRRSEKYKKNNPEKLKESIKKGNNSEKRKTWIRENRDGLKARNKKWRSKNKETLLKKQRDRYNNDPEIRMRFIIRGHLRRMISRKQKRTHEYISYSYEDLVNHLESLFKDGMSWENYGKWQIDHKRPLCSFNYFHDDGTENIEEIKKAMSLKNLQPLWSEDNRAKSGKYPLAS